MSVIYLVSHGGVLRRENDTLVYESHDGVRTKFFPHETEQVIMIGRVEITSAAFDLLMKHRIRVVFLSSNEKFNGTLEFQRGPNVFLRRKQYSLLDNPEFVLEFTRGVVISKLSNQLTIMRRIRRSGNRKINKAESGKSVGMIKNIIALAEHAESVAQLRGYEGRGARYYFSVFKNSFLPNWAVFNGRSKHPPKDNVNAILSLLYTFVFYRLSTACQIEGLDPYCGYFHALEYGKQTLVFDLMEEYRAPLVDRLTINLFNKGILDEDDFQFKDDEDFKDRAAVLLTKSGIKKVIETFEKELEKMVFYSALKRPVSYKKILLEQVRHLKQVIKGEEKTYHPWVMKR